MANGGAWDSEYYENPGAAQGRGEAPHHAAAMGVQANPPPMYNLPSRSAPAEGRAGVVVAVSLRLATFLFALIALALVVAGKGTFGITNVDSTELIAEKTVRFTILSGGKYLFAACVVVALYSLAMSALDLTKLCVHSLGSNKVVIAITFAFDQLFAYMLISAGAAGANAVIANTSTTQNVAGLSANFTCANLGIDGVCSKAAAAVALAFIAFLFLAITCVLSARRLFRL